MPLAALPAISDAFTPLVNKPPPANNLPVKPDINNLSAIKSNGAWKPAANKAAPSLTSILLPFSISSF